MCRLHSVMCRAHTPENQLQREHCSVLPRPSTKVTTPRHSRKYKTQGPNQDFCDLCTSITTCQQTAPSHAHHPSTTATAQSCTLHPPGNMQACTTSAASPTRSLTTTPQYCSQPPPHQHACHRTKHMGTPCATTQGPKRTHCIRGHTTLVSESSASRTDSAAAYTHTPTWHQNIQQHDGDALDSVAVLPPLHVCAPLCLASAQPAVTEPVAGDRHTYILPARTHLGT